MPETLPLPRVQSPAFPGEWTRVRLTLCCSGCTCVKRKIAAASSLRNECVLGASCRSAKPRRCNTTAHSGTASPRIVLRSARVSGAAVEAAGCRPVATAASCRASSITMT